MEETNTKEKEMKSKTRNLIQTSDKNSTKSRSIIWKVRATNTKQKEINRSTKQYKREGNEHNYKGNEYLGEGLE